MMAETTYLTILASSLCLALVMVAWRLVRGPNTADRFIAFDMLTALAIGFSAVVSVITNRGVFLDIALGLALINFTATAAFALFLERKGQDR